MSMGPSSGISTRLFGRHTEAISMIGLGGGHLARSSVTESDAIRIIQTAVEEGITFLDNAWDYGEGTSEIRFGKALKGRRDGVFLMTKVCARDQKTAMLQLEESLQRLQTDRVDLWQFHECNYDNDPEWIAQPNGALEAAIAAKAAGKTRYLGFTGHKSPHILQGMLDVDFPWDSCQMPINVFDSNFRSFQREVLPELTRRGIACLGMKSLGGAGQFVSNAGVSPELCRRYALSQPIATLICGIQSLEDLRQDLSIARGFSPMTTLEQSALQEQVRREASDGRHEWFKTTSYFDGQYHQHQHGFPAHAATPR